MGALWPRINVSLQAVAEILLVIGVGSWLSARRNLDRQAIASVSLVNWHALIPALMFSSIVGAVTPSNLTLLWPLMVLSLIHVVMGIVPALFLGWVTRLPKDMYFFAVMAASLPNCGNLPWLFMPTIIRYYTPADQVAAQIQYSTGLTSVYTIIVVLITLTVPFLFKKPHETLVLPRNSSLVLPRNSSTVSLGTQDDGTDEDSADLQHQQHLDDHSHQKRQQQQEEVEHNKDVHGHLHQQHQQHLQAASNPGATAWVVPVADLKPPAEADADVRPLDVIAERRMDRQPGTTVEALPSLDGLQSRDLPLVFHAQQHWQDQHQQQRQQQQEHIFSHQPYVGGVDSFSSHRSSSFLLSSRQLFGSFSRSFSRGVNRGLRRSASFVQLVWSYPTGWQPQRRGQGQGRQRPPSGTEGTRPAWLQKLCNLWAAFLAHPVVNLPLGATVVGIACAAIGPVRGVLVNELAPLHWLWLGLSWVGAAAAPIATMQIGAELMQTAPVGDSMRVSRRVQWTANAIAIVVKLIVVPLANIALLRLGGLSTLVPADDTVYQLLMLVEASVPAAVTLLVCCSRVYPDIRPLSSMLFWQYVASLFTLPALLVWYLYMLDI